MEAKDSKPAISSHLDLFSLSSSDVSTTNSLYVPVYTSTSLSEAAAPLEFNVTSNIFIYKYTFTYTKAFNNCVIFVKGCRTTKYVP